MLAPWKKTCDKPRQCIEKQNHYFANKVLSSHSYGFSSSHVWMWELGHKEGRGPKNWCLQIVVLEKTIESPLDCKEIQPVNPKRNQPWIFTGRTDVKAESPILWPPDAKNWLIWKDPNAGKDWEQEKTAAEDGMVGWHHQLKGHESEVSHSVMSNCLQPHGLYSPWNSLGQNIRVGSLPYSRGSSQPRNSSKALILWRTTFFIVSHPYVTEYWKNHSFDCTNLYRQSNVSVF